MKKTAVFNTLVRPYLVLKVGIIMVITIIGIPIALIWFLGVGQWWSRHYYKKLFCEIDDKRLRFRKGIFLQIEKTIPLENIQDVTFIEGPILRKFNLSILKFETAGQSTGQAHDMHLVGIVDAHEFRDMILTQRDVLKRSLSGSSGSSSDDAHLSQINEKMDRIIQLLSDNQ